jgi:carbamate kinase
METNTKRIVIALGGNALQKKGEASAKDQQKIASETAKALVPIIKAGHQIVIVHGNGPQVGNILIHEEAVNTAEVPTLPLDSCVAMSQGSIGYWLQQALTDELRKDGLNNTVVTVVTQMLVDKNDEAFKDPSKPIGPYYKTEADAQNEAKSRGFVVKEDSGRGWRRVVPSPKPLDIIEKDVIKNLVDDNFVVIAAGGGGVPVIMTSENGLQGIEAVIDKDYSAAVVADLIEADSLIILTAIDSVVLNYGTPQQQAINHATVAEMEEYIRQGHFPAGSMLPKVKAATQFANKPGRKAIIASLESAADAIDGTVGTTIVLH